MRWPDLLRREGTTPRIGPGRLAGMFLPWTWSIRTKLGWSFLVTILLLGKASHEGVTTMRASQETMALVERRYSEDVPKTLMLSRETEAINTLAYALSNVASREEAQALAAEIGTRLASLGAILDGLSESDLENRWPLQRLRANVGQIGTTIAGLVATVEGSIEARARSQRISSALIAAHGEFERALAEPVDASYAALMLAVQATSAAPRRDLSLQVGAAIARLRAAERAIAAAGRLTLPQAGPAERADLAAALDRLPRAGPAWAEVQDAGARLLSGRGTLSDLRDVAVLVAAESARLPVPVPQDDGRARALAERMLHDLARINDLLTLRAEVSTALGMQLSAAGAQTVEELAAYGPLFDAAKVNAQAGLRALSAARLLPRVHAATLRVLALGGHRGVFEARRSEFRRRDERAGLVDALQREAGAIAADVGLLAAAASANAMLATSAMNVRLEEGRRQLILLAVAGVLVNGLIAVAIMRSVSAPVRAMTRAMQGIARGNYSLDIPGRSRTDELGEMSRTLEVFAAAMSDLARSRDDLRRTALTDPLTGLPNRRGLAEHVQEIAANSAPGLQLAVMHVDLDKFKAVNDTLGHAAGDHVLLHCAHVLRAETRPRDIVARVGGDEFVVICRETAGEQQAAGIAGRLIRRLSEPIPFGDRVCRIGASIGIALWDPAETPDPERLLGDADIALYDAKGEGRGRYRFFHARMRQRVETRARLAQEIQAGLERDEFEPWLQPQIDLATGALAGFEALVRWRHPERGLQDPSRFMAAAAEAGLIDRLDERMLERACAALARLRRQGLPAPQVSVNVSASRLADPGLVDSVKWTADQAGLRPEHLALEILESVLLDERGAHAVGNIRRFAAAGFPVELDDFGTGHASISNLRNFPVHRMKIDRAFVSGIDHDNELRLMTGAIVRLGVSLGLQVLAEGVETEAELATVRALGCGWAQGFLIARPMPVPALEDWLRARGSHPMAELIARLDREAMRAFG